jgi:hypothetical protein
MTSPRFPASLRRTFTGTALPEDRTRSALMMAGIAIAVGIAGVILIVLGAK